MNNIKAWSFSAYSLYKQCPRKFKYIKLDKLKEPPSVHLERGNRVHKGIENYLKSRGMLPEECAQFVPEFQRIQALFTKRLNGALAEESWAYTRQWQPTAWFSKDAWLRAKVDCLFEADGVVTVIDWKTGKYSPQFNVATYLLQLELYALLVFLSLEHTQVVRPKLIFVDAGVVYPTKFEPVIEYTRDQVEDLKAAWEGRVQPMFDDNDFETKTSNLCQFCHFRKSNGGDCPQDR